MIENVEHFGAEFEFHALFDRDVFEQRKICVHESRPKQNVASEIAVSVWRWRRKRRCVDAIDQVAVAAICGSFANQVRPVRTWTGADVPEVRSHGNVERNSCLRCRYAIDLPVAE